MTSSYVWKTDVTDLAKELQGAYPILCPSGNNYNFVRLDSPFHYQQLLSGLDYSGLPKARESCAMMNSHINIIMISMMYVYMMFHLFVITNLDNVF